MAQADANIPSYELAQHSSSKGMITKQQLASSPPLSDQLADQQAPAVQQAKREAANVMTPTHVIGQVMAGLLVVTTLIFVLAWLAKRMGYTNFQGGSHMKVVATMPLGGREKAVLIEVGKETILLGVAPGRVNYLQTIAFDENGHSAVNDEEKPTDSVPIKKGQEFARYLKSIIEPGTSGSKSDGE